MRLFITGGSGLLGSRIAEIAINIGYDVYCGYNQHRPEFGKAVRIDLADTKTLSVLKEIRPDVIIHSAAITDVDKCEVERDLAMKVNAEGVKALSEIAKEIGSFLIYISTDYVFDGEKGMYSEEDETNPVNFYGYTKLLGEKFCTDFCIARTCVIYGARKASGKQNFVLWLIEKLRNGESVKVVTDQFVTPTLNTNLARMILEIAEERLKGIFHLAGATRISRFDFALEIAREFGLDKGLIIPAKMHEMRWIARRPRDSSLSTSKARRVLREKPYELSRALKVLKGELYEGDSC